MRAKLSNKLMNSANYYLRENTLFRFSFVGSSIGHQKKLSIENELRVLPLKSKDGKLSHTDCPDHKISYSSLTDNLSDNLIGLVSAKLVCIIDIPFVKIGQKYDSWERPSQYSILGQLNTECIYDPIFYSFGWT